MSERNGPDRAIAEALRLRGDPPKVARLSRRAIALLAGVAAAAIAGVTGWGLSSHPHDKASPAPQASTPASPPERLNELPKDYASLPTGVPKLGPPLPGDLGRPLLDGRGPAPEAAVTPMTAHEQQAQQEASQARTSRLFGAELAQAAPAEPQLPSAAQAPEPAVHPAQPVNAPDVSDARLTAPVSPYLLQAGTMIRAALITGIRSDLPGLVTAQVTDDVLDSVSGRWILVPQGSRLIGTYEDKTSFGQTRVLVSWTRLILPDGRSIELDHAPAADAHGYAGLSDGVDHKWGQLLSASVVSTLLGVGSEMGATGTDNQVVQALRMGVATSTNQVGQQLVGKTLQIQPSLVIRPGFPVRVMLTKDLDLQPWSGE